MGPVKKTEVEYDNSDRSNGNATVTFSKKSDANAAVQRFNGTELVGKKLEISILPEEEKPEKPEKRFRERNFSGPKLTNGNAGNANSFVISAGRAGRRVRPATFGGRGGGRGRGGRAFGGRGRSFF